jgi:hypothetical protein
MGKKYPYSCHRFARKQRLRRGQPVATRAITLRTSQEQQHREERDASHRTARRPAPESVLLLW